MGDQLIVFKVMPEEPGQDEGIKEKLRILPVGKVQEIRTEPIAFGLNALRVGVVTESIEGIADRIADEIKKIKNVSDVTIEVISLI